MDTLAFEPYIERMARVHWWHRFRESLSEDERIKISKGHSSDAVEAEWNKVSLSECIAMAHALDTVTLKTLLKMAEEC